MLASAMRDTPYHPRDLVGLSIYRKEEISKHGGCFQKIRCGVSVGLPVS